MADVIDSILRAWAAGRNALLYGPPGTGKTLHISELFDALNEPEESSEGILLDPDNAQQPFTRPERDIPIPLPVKVVWTTFHQSYGYEDFVIAMRPKEVNGATTLAPWAGILLDAAMELNDPSSEFNSVVIFIDEINRGNAARIFGEFMTFLDFTYREDGDVPLPVPLRQLAYNNDVSEPIQRPSGGEGAIPSGMRFPKHIYIAATMNSVDRAAIPIDSALARRFNRIEVRPDVSVLLNEWQIDPTTLPIPDDTTWSELSPYETAVLMLDRMNVRLATDLGAEFELGHGLLMSLKQGDADPWTSLAQVWDEVVYPQLEDRYSGRPEQLLDLLKVETPPPGDYAWTLRSSLGGSLTERVLQPVRVAELDSPTVERSFRWLTF